METVSYIAICKIAQPMDLSIVPEHKTCVLRGLGQRPNKHETGGFRVNGICLFSQSGYRFALLASIIPNLDS